MCRDGDSVHSLCCARTASHSATACVYSRTVRRGLVIFARCVQADGPFRPDQVDSVRRERVLVSDPRRRAAGTLSRRSQSSIRLAFPRPQYGFFSPDVSVWRRPPGTAFPNLRRIREWSNRGNNEEEVYVRAGFSRRPADVRRRGGACREKRRLHAAYRPAGSDVWVVASGVPPGGAKREACIRRCPNVLESSEWKTSGGFPGS